MPYIVQDACLCTSFRSCRFILTSLICIFGKSGVAEKVVCTCYFCLQLKRLKLRKNNWDCETYQFDEVLTETSSQKRVYEVVAKPVVEVYRCLLHCMHLEMWNLVSLNFFSLSGLHCQEDIHLSPLLEKL